MRVRKNGSRKSSTAKALELCIKVVAVIIEEYTLVANDLGYNRKEILAFAEAVARLGEKARSEKHLAELIDRLDDEMLQQRVPRDQWGTQLLNRVVKASSDGD